MRQVKATMFLMRFIYDWNRWGRQWPVIQQLKALALISKCCWWREWNSISYNSFSHWDKIFTLIQLRCSCIQWLQLWVRFIQSSSSMESWYLLTFALTQTSLRSLLTSPRAWQITGMIISKVSHINLLLLLVRRNSWITTVRDSLILHT